MKLFLNYSKVLIIRYPSIHSPHITGKNLKENCVNVSASYIVNNKAIDTVEFMCFSNEVMVVHGRISNPTFVPIPEFSSTCLSTLILTALRPCTLKQIITKRRRMVTSESQLLSYRRNNGRTS
jgi:hypothetical protein